MYRSGQMVSPSMAWLTGSYALAYGHPLSIDLRDCGEPLKSGLNDDANDFRNCLHSVSARIYLTDSSYVK